MSVPKMGFERAGELEQVKLGDLLWDVHAAGMKLLEFTAGRELAGYEESELLQQVVGALLGIMGDRLGQMERQFPTEFAKIDGARRLMAVPGEAGEKVWRVVEEVVPEAVEQVRAVLEEWHGA